jgi:hypothetical protein
MEFVECVIFWLPMPGGGDPFWEQQTKKNADGEKTHVKPRRASADSDARKDCAGS